MTYKLLPQPSAQNKQIREYLKAAQKGQDTLFMASFEGGWTVRSVGPHSSSKTFKTKEAALLYTKKLGGIVIFQDRDAEDNLS